MSVPRVSVVIPTLNEARNLPSVLPRLPADVYEVILVDGRSTDGTADVARSIRPDVRIVHQPGRGKGDALRAGFEAATGEIIVALDADGSNDPGEIPVFVAALMSGADFVKGSRFLPGGGTADMPFHRKLGNATFVQLVRLLFNCRYTDLCYGYNAFWRRILPVLELDGDGFEIETEMNVRILRAGLDVREVPSFEAERIYGESNLQAIPDGLRVMRTIIHERLRPLSDAMRAHALARGAGAAARIAGEGELAPVAMGLASGGVREAAGGYVSTMATALDAIDVGAVLQLAERLRMARDRSRTIHLLADRASFGAAEQLAHELRHDPDGSMPVHVKGPTAAEHGIDGHAEPGDVLLLFASDGNDPGLVAAAHAARRGLVDSVAVIGIDGGLLARETDHLVLTNAARSVPRSVASLHAIVSDIVMTALTHERSAVAQLAIEQLSMASVPVASTTERVA